MRVFILTILPKFREVKSCNVIQEEKCATNYVTETETQCNTVNEQKCETTYNQECTPHQEDKCQTIVETKTERQCQVIILMCQCTLTFS